MRENMDQKNSEYGHFPHGDSLGYLLKVTNNGMREKHITLYKRKYKIASLDIIAILGTHVCINKPYSRSSGITTFL